MNPSRDLRVSTFLAQWWQSFIRLDGPIQRSIIALFTCPGRLAAAYFQPESGGRLAHPVRLYLTLNVIFFFFAPWLSDSNLTLWSMQHSAALGMHSGWQPYFDEAVRASGGNEALYKLLFDDRMASRQGVWVWVMIPILGAVSCVAGFKRRRFLVEHLVFATHLVSFFLASLLTLGVVGRLGQWISGGADGWVIWALLVILAWLIWVPIVGYRSVRSFFGFKSRFLSVLMTGWLAGGFALSVWIYIQVLFFATLVGMRGLDLSV